MKFLKSCLSNKNDAFDKQKNCIVLDSRMFLCNILCLFYKNTFIFFFYEFNDRQLRFKEDLQLFYIYKN